MVFAVDVQVRETAVATVHVPEICAVLEKFFAARTQSSGAKTK